MGKRLFVVLVVVAAVLALTAPAAFAAISVTDMSPSYGIGGDSVTCTISGDFYKSSGLITALTPSFKLVSGATTITGTTDSYTFTSANVTFPLPLDGPQATYDLQASQAHRLIFPPEPFTIDIATLPSAFSLYLRPSITSISPASVLFGSADVTLVVNGARFVTSSVPFGPHSTVKFNGESLTTTYNSSTRLTAVIPAAKLTTPGDAQITVWNSAGIVVIGSLTGVLSNAATFSVTVPTPVITAIDPSTAIAGGAAFNLGVTGSDFLTNAAVVLWNGTPLVTQRDSSTHLTAAVPATLIAAAATATVTVRNGTAGAPVSNGMSFTIGNLPPALSSISPTALWAGCVRTDIVLTVNGSNFLNGSRIVLSGGDKTNTTFVSTSQLTVPITPADMALPVASFMVSVKNPPFPPGTSSAGGFPLPLQKETTDPTITISGADNGWHNAPVPLTFTASDAQSGVQKVQYMVTPGVASWTDGTSYTVPVTTQGQVTVGVQALDWCNRVGSASATVKIDTTPPVSDALNAVSVKRGKTARLKFRVTEPDGLSPTATVLLQVKKGRTVKLSKTLSGVPMNKDQAYSFKVRLAKGSYKWYVKATDAAGNAQAKPDSAAFTVK